MKLKRREDNEEGKISGLMSRVQVGKMVQPQKRRERGRGGKQFPVVLDYDISLTANDMNGRYD